MTSGKECINKSLIKLLSSDSKEDWKVAFTILEESGITDKELIFELKRLGLRKFYVVYWDDPSMITGSCLLDKILGRTTLNWLFYERKNS